VKNILALLRRNSTADGLRECIARQNIYRMMKDVNINPHALSSTLLKTSADRVTTASQRTPELLRWLQILSFSPVKGKENLQKQGGIYMIMRNME